MLPLLFQFDGRPVQLTAESLSKSPVYQNEGFTVAWPFIAFVGKQISSLVQTLLQEVTSVFAFFD